MIAVYASTLVILAASLAIGAAILGLLGWRRSGWLAGATGFATLVVAAPLLIRLPGRATTATIAILLLTTLSLVHLWRNRSGRPGDPPGDRTGDQPGDRPGSSGRGADDAARSRTPGPEVAAASPRPANADTSPNLPTEGPAPAHTQLLVACATGLATLALASLPFLLNANVGVLGEGVYTNDHAAQLYWASWLQTGFGPEPAAVQFGYPIGPQALAVVAAELTGASLVSAFNGLLLAIPVLTALTALGAVRSLPAPRAIAVATLAGLPYLAASFLAQSAFKETAMALFVLAFALALGERRAGARDEPGWAERRGASGGLDPAASQGSASTRTAEPRWRAVIVVGALLAAASVFTFSIPGLAWFAGALAVWVVLEWLQDDGAIDPSAVRAALARHRRVLVAAALAAAALAAFAAGPVIEFAEKIDDVQDSQGRLSSPVFPGEAFGIWPEGDFRIVRGEVTGSLVASAIGALALAFGVWRLVRARELALLSMLVAGAAIYVASRPIAQIHVEAKALAIIAPLVLLVSLRALVAPDGRPGSAAARARYAVGGLVALGALASTVLALRAAPVGFDERQLALERLAEQAPGEPLAFLGVDRFAGYYLRETLARAPAGYVPEEVESRPEKRWQQGLAADFDTLDTGKLDKFGYAITTAAAFASTPPANFEEVARDGDYVLWRRDGETPRSRVLEEGGDPGAVLPCAGGPDRPGRATILADPAVARFDAWRTEDRVETAAAGQELAFAAPGEASVELDLGSPGAHELSLQYHSEAALELLGEDGEVIAELPPSLEGMYISGAGRGAFWPAGELESADGAPVTLTVRALDPGGIRGALGSPPRVWLGDLAASPVREPREVAIAAACGRYVDHFTLARGGGA